MGQLEVNVADATQRLEGLETLTQDLERTQIHGQPALVLTGANFHVRSGAGATDASPNGRGNLVVGYDEGRSSGTARKTGSHNLIVGKGHSYTSHAGVVFGLNQPCDRAVAALGGQFNRGERGSDAWWSRGAGTRPPGSMSACSAGSQRASGADHASVLGRDDNQASGCHAVGVRRRENAASGHYSSVVAVAPARPPGRFSSVQGAGNAMGPMRLQADRTTGGGDMSGGLNTTVTHAPHQHAP